MTRRLAQILLVVMSAFLAVISEAQAGPGPCDPEQPSLVGTSGPMRMRGPASGLSALGGGRWWNNSQLAMTIGLTASQVNQIENIFQHYRAQLMEQHSALLKQEAGLAPLIEAVHLDEAQVTARIDKVAQAWANLEKLNAQMLLAIRRVLKAEQWRQLRLRHNVGPPV